jgi:hypothetical protein
MRSDRREWFSSRLAQLDVVQASVQAATGHQFLVGAQIGGVPGFHDQDAVGQFQRGEADA